MKGRINGVLVHNRHVGLCQWVQEADSNTVIMTAGPMRSAMRGVEDKVVFLDDEVEPKVLSVIQNATRNVIFVTPYLHLWGHLRNAIDKAISKGVKISFIIRSNGKRQIEDIEWLLNHKVKLYELPDLHAKIYTNERGVLISSMNITEYSTTNSREFAMTIQSEKDATRFQRYVSDLMSAAEPVQFPQSEEQDVGQVGRCIRCGQKIDFNPGRPLCDKCYEIWAAYSNESYLEEYCHLCGNPSEVSYAKPLCRACYERKG